MSSSLSELRNFRMNKTNVNGSKLANGRKRIRVISDSSDDEHEKKQAKKLQQNGSPSSTTSTTPTKSSLSVSEKEERLRQLREMVQWKSDAMSLQDALFHNDWNVQKAYELLSLNPKFTTSVKTFIPTRSAPTNRTNDDGRSPPAKKVRNHIFRGK